MSGFKSLVALLLLVPFCAIPGRAEDLKLLVSVQQQNIVAPSPLRATLHIHNSGKQTIWLYRPVRSTLGPGQGDSAAPGIGQHGPGQAYGGSTLEVQLVALNKPGSDKQQAAGRGFVIAPDALPYPRLVRVGPGKDYDEKVNIQIDPAQTKTSSGNEPLWGQYRFSVSYAADYSNADILARDIGADLWHGHVSSNTVTLDLRPPVARDSIAGSVFDSVGRTYSGALVTLSDDNENALSQQFSDADGRFSFTHLPSGRYWITVRQPGSAEDTSVFRHLDLNQANSPETAQIMMTPVRIDKGDRVLHKPVLFHVVDNKGNPLPNVKIAILRTTGNVIESLKTQTGEDGFTEIGLIPGDNLVTLRRQGCKNVERRADVAYGPGVDGFKFEFECTKK